MSVHLIPAESPDAEPGCRPTPGHEAAPALAAQTGGAVTRSRELDRPAPAAQPRSPRAAFRMPAYPQEAPR